MLWRKTVNLAQIRKRNLFEQSKCYSFLWWKVLGSTGCSHEAIAQAAEQGTRVEQLCQARVRMTHHFKSHRWSLRALLRSLWSRMDLSVEAMRGSGWWCSCMGSFHFWPLRASWCRCTACRRAGEKLVMLATRTGDTVTPGSTSKIYNWTFLEPSLVCGCKGFKWWVTFQGVKRYISSMLNHILSVKKFCTFLEDNIYRKYSH